MEHNHSHYTHLAHHFSRFFKRGGLFSWLARTFQHSLVWGWKSLLNRNLFFFFFVFSLKLLLLLSWPIFNIYFYFIFFLISVCSLRRKINFKNQITNYYFVLLSLCYFYQHNSVDSTIIYKLWFLCVCVCLL